MLCYHFPLLRLFVAKKDSKSFCSVHIGHVLPIISLPIWLSCALKWFSFACVILHCLITYDPPFTFDQELYAQCTTLIRSLFEKLFLFFNWQCQNVQLSITDMFVIDHKEMSPWLITKLFVINQGLFSFCYYCVVGQNVQWLIEENDGCWVVDRAVVFVAGGGRFELSHV